MNNLALVALMLVAPIALFAFVGTVIYSIGGMWFLSFYLLAGIGGIVQSIWEITSPYRS